MTLRRPPQGQARICLRNTRRSSSCHGCANRADEENWLADGIGLGRRPNMKLGRGTRPPTALARSPFAISRPDRRRRGSARGEPSVVGPAWRDVGKQFARLEDQDLAAVTEAPLHAVRKLALRKRREPLLRERWTVAMAAQVRQALPVVRVQMNARV
jgi:hypothetical protein